MLSGGCLSIRFRQQLRFVEQMSTIFLFLSIQMIHDTSGSWLDWLCWGNCGTAGGVPLIECCRFQWWWSTRKSEQLDRAQCTQCKVRCMVALSASHIHVHSLAGLVVFACCSPPSTEERVSCADCVARFGSTTAISIQSSPSVTYCTYQSTSPHSALDVRHSSLHTFFYIQPTKAKNARPPTQCLSCKQHTPNEQTRRACVRSLSGQSVPDQGRKYSVSK